MPKPRLPQRNFRGPTPEGVIQTVSIGEGAGRYLLRQAAKFPRRKYVATDEEFDKRYLTEHAETMRKAGITVLHLKPTQAIKWLADQGLRVRHFNVDLPMPLSIDGPRTNFHRKGEYMNFMGTAADLLLPNGKIFFMSESRDALKHFLESADLVGFKPGKVVVEKSRNKTAFAEEFHKHGMKIYRVALRLHPKEYKKWP